jgi:hypothetical protein
LKRAAGSGGPYVVDAINKSRERTDIRNFHSQFVSQPHLRRARHYQMRFAPETSQCFGLLHAVDDAGRSADTKISRFV